MVRLIAVFTLVTSGCSMMLMDPAPAPPWHARPDCEPENVMPAIDLIVAGNLAAIGLPLLLIAVAVGSADDPDLDSEGVATGLAVAGAGFTGGALLFAYSGLTGFKKSRRCREARQDWERANQPAPPLSPPGNVR